MAKLAIKGHPKRGKEVIEILEMLGGENNDCSGKDIYTVYAITNNGYIYPYQHSYKRYPDDFRIFTLEEFLKKFPYKVGDKVVCTKFGDDYPTIIQTMKWTGTTIEYTFDDCVTCLTKDLQPYKEETIGERIYKTNKVIFEANAHSCDIMNNIIKEEDTGNGIIYDEIDFDRCPAADKVHLILGDNYEIKEENGNYYVVRKKPQYPTTYEECCKVLGIDVSRTIGHSEDLPFYNDVTCYENNLLSSLAVLRKLRVCRDAYWKIYGEEMGLGKPWKPDWKNPSERKYCIINTEGDITKWVQQNTNKILAFPTEEMRDAYKENFDNDIEACKEFL